MIIHVILQVMLCDNKVQAELAYIRYNILQSFMEKGGGRNETIWIIAMQMDDETSCDWPVPD